MLWVFKLEVYGIICAFLQLVFSGPVKKNNYALKITVVIISGMYKNILPLLGPILTEVPTKSFT